MTPATSTNRSTPDPQPQMSGPVAFSLFFHGFVVLLLVTGLPFLKADPIDVSAASMTVELVSTDELKDVKASKPKPVKAEAPPKPPIPQMPTVTAKTPPKPVAPERPEPVEAVAPPPIEKAEVKEATKPDPKPAAPPKPQKRPVLTNPEPEPVEKQEEFQGLLRNLMEQAPQAAPEDKAVDKASSPEESPLARFSQQLTPGEFDALRAQLSQCWSVLAGARHADELQVQIRLTVNPDRTIRSASIVDQLRYSRDSYFQAAADEALRAVRNPGCNPLQLPPDKYEQWKSIVVTFDPSKLL